MNKNFVEYSNDPTKPLNTDFADSVLSQKNIETEYAKLSEQERLIVACRILGMNHTPVDILTFLYDDYYLGPVTNHGSSVFPFWLDKLQTIFPNPVTTKTPYISLGGAIGTGKSFMSKMSGLYQYHRLDCCTNVFASLGLAGGSKLAFGFFHANYETAYKDFVQFYKYVFDVSPYFQNLYNNPQIRLIASGPQSTGAVLGSQLIYCVLSELSFWKSSDAWSKLNEVLGRYESRFKNKRFNFGNVIVDSSAKDSDNSVVKKFEEDMVPKNELFSIHPPQYEVRPELYAESEGKTFDFYIGDSIQEPRVIEDGEDLIKNNMDPDRIVKVPISAKYRFLNDPIRNLRDICGIPYSGNELFFNGNLSHLLKCSRIKNYAPEIVVVDFYDKSDTIFSHVSNMVYRIPRGTNIFVHYDIGLRKDITGISLCYYDGEMKQGNTSVPKFKFPLIFGVSRKKGQSTSLDHLYQFITDLRSNGYNVTFSADSFASAGIFQSCQRDGIECVSISVDKTMDAANMFKNVINTERAELPYVNRLLRECSELRLVFNGKSGEHAKVDHPLTSNCTEFDYKDSPAGTNPGSKDLSDAAMGSLYSCYQKYAKYLEGGYSSGITKSIDAINKITANPREESQARFQEMLEGLF